MPHDLSFRLRQIASNIRAAAAVEEKCNKEKVLLSWAEELDQIASERWAMIEGPVERTPLALDPDI